MEAPFPGCPELSAWHAHSLAANQAPARRQALKRSSSGGDDDGAAKRSRNRAEVSPPPPSLRRPHPLPPAPSPSHLTPSVLSVESSAVIEKQNATPLATAHHHHLVLRQERLSWTIGNNGVPPHNHPHRDMYDNLRALS